MTMNNRKTILATLLAALAAAPLAIAPVQVQAQAYPQPQAPASHIYTQAELDQMLAPVALYPDALLSQVLMAATYPIEVAEASRWCRANPGLRGDDAVRAVQGQDWDPSVKSLVAFPEILQQMEERPEWTQALGDAFLAQQPQVMDRVQLLRHRARAAGHLRSDERIVIRERGPIIVVEPVSPEYVYVPYYDPLEVYGTWWWPSYRPVYWAPWPGYARPRASFAFWWGRPVGLSVGFFFGDFDWRQRYVRVAYPNSYYYRAPSYYSGRTFVAGARWQHDPQHRRSVDYRSTEVRQRFAGAQFQAQPGARTQLQAQPQARSPQVQQPAPSDRRDDRRFERRVERQPAQSQVQPAARAPVQTQTQVQAPAVAERRAERERMQTERREARQAQPQARPQPEARPQPQARAQPEFRPQPQARVQQEPRPQPQARQEPRPQPQARQEQRASAPAAQAAQQSRAERREQRQEKREHRGEHEKG
jgi:hypothetical protein